MTHIKKQTDIGNFPVKKIAKVDDNITLADIKTYGSLIINRHDRAQKQFVRRQKRVNKIVEEIK